MKIISKKNQTDYLRMVDQIDAERMLLRDYNRLEDKSGKRYVCIRHDIDHDIDHALRFAEIEAKHGIQATYFILDYKSTGPGYFDYTDAFFAKLKFLQDMGHEVGWHNNSISAWVNHEPAFMHSNAYYIQGPLCAMRHHGIDVVGTASHGDPECKRYDYVNYEIWEDWEKGPKNPGLFKTIHRMPLSDARLEYEAYFIKRDAYLSDSGGRWAGWLRKDIPDFEGRSGDGSNVVRIQIINEFNTWAEGFLQVLVHPIWWEVK